MTSFSLWLQHIEKYMAPKQVTWVCGSEAVLVSEVVNTSRELLAVEPWNSHTFVVGEDREKDIWAAIDAHPVDNTPRFILVRNADKLKKPERLIEFLKTRTSNPKTNVMFVSRSSSPERLPAPKTEWGEKKVKGELVPYLAALSGKGHLVECRSFTQATAKHAVAWMQTKVEILPGVAGHLYNRANGDLRVVRDVLVKLANFPGQISKETVDALMAERPKATFVDGLLAMDKRTALLALERMQEDEYSSAIGLLDQRLDVLGNVHDMVISNYSMAQIARGLGRMGFLAKDLVPVSKVYDQKRRMALRKLLEATDEVLQARYSVGAMEALCLFW